MLLTSESSLQPSPRKFTETDWGQPGQRILQGPEYCTGGREAASFETL
ncbi:hypothetical protein LEMLEM_LOCUS4300 [Lemmus lemmus]